MISHLTMTISTTELNPTTQKCFLDGEKTVVYNGVVKVEIGLSLEEKVVYLIYRIISYHS